MTAWKDGGVKMGSNSSYLVKQFNNGFMMEQELKKAIENQQKRSEQTKKGKKQKKQETQHQTQTINKRVKKQNNAEDEEKRKVDEERQMKEEQVKKMNNLKFQSNTEGRASLREAMILAEIIGQPRCKDRRARRRRRG